MDESIQVSCIINKRPPSWKDFKHTLKHLKDELTLIELGSHLRIEESLIVYTDNKGKRKHHDIRANPNKKLKVTCCKCGKPRHLKKDCKAGNVGNKANGSSTKGSKDGFSNPLKGQNICWFKTYESLNDGFILHMVNESTALVHGRGCVDLRFSSGKDAIFDEHGFSSVPRPSQRSLDDPKTFDEVMKSFDVAFWKEAINDEIDSIMGNNTWVLTDLPPGIDYFDTYAPVARISNIILLIVMASIHNLIIHQMDVKTAFLNEELEEEVYINQPMGFIMSGNENKFDASGKGVIICLYADDMLIFGTNQVQVDLTKPYIAFVVRKLSRYTSNPRTQHWQAIQRVLKYLRKTMDYRLVYSGYPSVLEGYTDASWISNTEDNSSTSGWVFLFDGGAISWASKKQTCITGSTMEYEFMALAAAGKEGEWLKNLLLEIPLWVKPIAPIFIRCDSAATLAKAYSQMYNRKSRHLGVRHNMIRELITNEVLSIEFMAEAHVLQIIPRMCLRPAGKEDEVANFLMVNFFEKVLSRSMNKEKPLMDLFIPVSGIEVRSVHPEVPDVTPAPNDIGLRSRN
nr:zinc finger, CCHC-type [Tanacetum cinerariifolium]